MKKKKKELNIAMKRTYKEMCKHYDSNACPDSDCDLCGYDSSNTYREERRLFDLKKDEAENLSTFEKIVFWLITISLIILAGFVIYKYNPQ